jgi:hypothetical protein
LDDDEEKELQVCQFLASFIYALLFSLFIQSTELSKVKACVISDFCRDVDEICAILGYYAALRYPRRAQISKVKVNMSLCMP